MATQGPFYPSTAISAAVHAPEDDDAWVTPTNVGADDGAEASITAASFDGPADVSRQLYASGFGFTIPAGATIDGVTVEIQRRALANTAEDFRVQLSSAENTFLGNNKADTVTAWPTTATTVSYGGVADVWGASLTPTVVNAAGFGVTLSAQALLANADVWVDFIRVTITYTAAAGTDLTVQEATVTIAADNVTLSPVLAVQDATITVAADNVTLVPNLIVQDAIVTVVADNVVLTGVPIDLTVQDAAITVVADNVTLSPNLLVADAMVDVIADNIILVPNLIVADASITVVPDNVVLEVVAGGLPSLDATGSLLLTTTPTEIPLSAYTWDSDGDVGDHLNLEVTISKTTSDTLRGWIYVRLDLDGVEISRFGYFWPHEHMQHHTWTSPLTLFRESSTEKMTMIAAEGPRTLEAFAWLGGPTEPSGVTISVTLRVIDH